MEACRGKPVCFPPWAVVLETKNARTKGLPLPDNCIRKGLGPSTDALAHQQTVYLSEDYKPPPPLKVFQPRVCTCWEGIRWVG
jgi:hypothetical protein